MTELAAIRPDEVNLALFAHVLTALTLIGAVGLALFALAGSWRGGMEARRLAFRSLLWGAIPAWILMRGAAQWILSEERLEDAELEWIEIGFATAEPTFLLLVIATVIAWRRTKAPEGPSVADRIAIGLVSTCMIAYLFALWAMTTKPV